MAGCCCGDDAAIDKAEEGAYVSSMQKYPTWILDTVNDITTKYDCTAISRDFPRMVVLLSPPSSSTDDDSRGKVPTIVDISKADAGQQDITDVPRRSEKAKRLVLGICELCGEAEAFGAQLAAAWAAADKDLAGDLSGIVNASLVSSGLVSDIHPTEAAPALPARQDSNAGEDQFHEPAAPATPQRLRLHPASRTSSVLLCFTQGVVFYAVQRLRYLLSFSWVQLQDVAWISRCFTRPPTSGTATDGLIVVLHHQLTKNFVCDGDKSKVPEFEVEYQIEILLSASDAKPVDVVMTVGHCRSVKASCTSKLMNVRLEALRSRLLEVFDVQLEEVKTLVSSAARRY